MSNDWIKMRNNLRTDPDVFYMAQELGVDEFSIVGRLHTFWSWADQHTSTGTLNRTSPAWIDRLVSCPGFSDALVRIGWLVVRHDSLILPEWDRHNGSSAKSRARDAIRKKGERDYKKTIEDPPISKCPKKSGHNPDKTRTREEESREEKNNIPTATASACAKDGIVSSNSDFSQTTDRPPPSSEPVGNKEWIGILKHTYPDRDVEGELKTFQNFCQRKGTAANRNGFVGWLKKASPAIQAIQEPKPQYSYS